MNAKNYSSIAKCVCEEGESSSGTSPKDKRIPRLTLSSLGLNLKRGRSLHLNAKRGPKKEEEGSMLRKWGLKLGCTKKAPKPPEREGCCSCTCYKKKEEAVECAPQNSEEDDTDCASRKQEEGDETSFGEGRRSELERGNDREEQEEQANLGIYETNFSLSPTILNGQFVDVHWIRSVHEDCDERARLQRAREIERGIDAPADFRSVRRVQLLCSTAGTTDPSDTDMQVPPRRLQLVCPPDLTVDSIRALFQTHVTVRSCPLDTYTGCHTQVDFVHCLVPDLLEITNCSFYWGKMDRYEAERLLDGKPEGTFLLRDSAQEEFLFSVSFRKYNRSLHARIEQWNHKFSFDSHDPNVYTSDTVCGLIKHYKDPSSCMFFEPMLTRPLHRNFTLSLQHLCRATIVNRLTYDNVNQLQLPKALKSYLKEYHYRQKVRVERFDDDIQWLDLRKTLP